ncbi:MAG TPA: bifunctional phosphoribosylaminoimidazolecarboxamide formyltransferase/IMP cyclohydrolase [Nitrospinota bacterium]|nr:bifunctional phosphoribosylaminoimidazolecarboxamide formyltransferase/IMP cyclohydrolase [Nitrospinota bacterium]
MKRIKRVLISVSDKEGVVEFAKALSGMGVEILSTGGTNKLLTEKGIKVSSVSDYTGFPEILDGRVKTLHPKILGGILAVRGSKEHENDLRSQNIGLIDMVVVNLYPFEETVSKPGILLEKAIENIDIGGPSMLRAAAKNFNDVAVVINPKSYNEIISEMRENNGCLSDKTRFRLAKKVFQHTARYDSVIFSYLVSLKEDKEVFPKFLNLPFEKVQDLRYGENPHQKGGFYKEFPFKETEPSIISAKQLHGKELSFNNIIDLDAALALVNDFEETAAAIIKHTNPCGVAVDKSLVEAYRKARETDPMSAFGGIIGLNDIVDTETANEISKTFIEAVIAPDYEPSALEVLKRKKNLRIMKVEGWNKKRKFDPNRLDMKKVVGGMILQERDLIDIDLEKVKIPTKRKPTEQEFKALKFGWTVVKHVKSNAIVYSTENQAIGIGAGQMSRVDSAKIAAMKANLPLKGSVMASDAFFPFRDAVDEAAEKGITAIIQPGGSVNDEEIIKAADSHNIAMIFTGIRHFKH